MKTETGCATILVVWAILFALSTWLFQTLWNWLVPSVFGGATITFWQAAGLSFLLNIAGGAFRAAFVSRG